MGLTKSDLFEATQNELAAFAKALGHPARVAILEHLFRLKACVCGSLAEEIGLAQPTISQHLKVLRDLGLIKGRIDGTSVCYCIDKERWSTMKAALLHFLEQDTACASDGCC